MRKINQLIINVGKREYKIVSIDRGYFNVLMSLMHFYLQGNVRDWLVEYRLEEYWHMFESKACTDPEALQDLKMKSERNPRQYLKEKFEIEKPGHLRRLIEALHSLLPSPGTYDLRKITYSSPHIFLKAIYLSSYDIYILSVKAASDIIGSRFNEW